MAFGLFGKLPQKRDFLSVGLPHAVLNPFETWLQSGVAASRSEIGRNWEDYYLVAPIWRFWLGKEVLGVAATGSLMPSVDQVGRYFPLAIIYYAEPAEQLVPPLINPIEEWYQAIEQRLLSVLAEDVEVDVSRLLTGLEPPDYSRPVPKRHVPAAAPFIAPPPVSEPVAPLPEPVEVPAAPSAPATAPAPMAVLGGAPAEAPTPQAVAEPSPAEPAPVTETAPEAEPADPVEEATAELWSPVPMAADKVAELQRISAASFAPAAVAPTGGSLWDLDPVPAASAPAAAASPIAEPVAAVAPPPASAWAEPLPVDPPAAEPEPPSFDEPVFDADPVAAPAPEWSPEPVAAPVVRIESGEFKGGFVSSVEDGATFVDALQQLIALEHANAASVRSYWWCGASSQGGPRLHSRQGLPDPYFFTRMLMWNRP